ncbi:BON domain-containing protein [Edaphobacter aggregans]|uniref:BON domain-containing protein n=1 Tax=Edaphobacter aggregans TaxID=570835 RepID=UPI00054ED5FB|nr:BON domain-containing protein [Edaphobacter aggregans]
MNGNGRLWLNVAGMVLGAGLAASAGLAQDKPMPDAQVESNVLRALAGAPELADQAIGTTTVYGVVTLTGTVRDEASREKAEQLVANTVGVKKVVDEMTVGTPESATTEGSQPPEETAGEAAPEMNPNAQAEGAPAPQAQVGSTNSAPAQIERSQTAPPGSSAQPGPQPGPQSGPAYPPSYGTQPYGNYPQPRRIQQAGMPVVVPAGTMVRVRINQAMDSRRTQPGMMFNGVVISDVIADGAVAIPRGAPVQGQVVDTHPGGNMRGRGGLALELTQVTLEGHPYPLATEAYEQQGYDKTGQTVGNTVGLGAVGAMIGAIAGGGPGALAGAGIGGVAGLGVSSLSKQGEAVVPSEAIVSFRLSQQAALTTASQGELDRLAAELPPPGAGQPQMRRRYPPPPPGYGPGYYGPGYYGPAYYPYPYYYPYYR